VLAVRREEISKVIPLFGLAPVFVAVMAAVLLGEVFSPLTYIGIALVLGGAITLSVQRVEGFRFNAAFWLMIGAAASVAVTEIASKYLLGKHDYWSVFAYTRCASALSLIPIALWKNRELFDMIRQRESKVIGLMVSAELLNMLGILSVVIAASKGYVTLVNALTQVQPFIVLVLAALLSRVVPQLIREEGGMRVFARKLGSITVMFIGVVLILSLQHHI
jgi:drug/metabolite transporter (DMT)-like permease